MTTPDTLQECQAYCEQLKAENADLRRRVQIAEYTVGRQDEMITSLEDEISQLRLARHAELDEFRAAVGSLR